MNYDKQQVVAEKGSLEYKHELDAIDANPLVITLYEFLTEPKSSSPSFYWAFFLASIVCIRILAIGLESCDGPNQYAGRPNHALFKFLFDSEQYWQTYIACMIPCILDAFVRIIALGFIAFVQENKKLFKKIKSDRFNYTLYLCDIVGVTSFLFAAMYLRPNKIVLDESGRVFLRIIELSLTSKIFRISKDIPSIWAIRIALTRAAPHLVVPLFFFFAFNITASVILYFIEPCYNTGVCPWKNLFDVSFFSIVTMTTTGYGNQVPQFELGRLIACCIMLFGSLFLSMPLAIIGNEYEDAWAEVNEILKKEREAKEKIEKMRLEAMKNKSRNANRVTPMIMQSSVILNESLDDLKKKEEDKLERDSPLSIAFKQMILLVNQMEKDLSISFRLSPFVLMQLCELRGVISALIITIRSNVYILTAETSAISNSEIMLDKNGKRITIDGARKLSMFGGHHRTTLIRKNDENNQNNNSNNNNDFNESKSNTHISKFTEEQLRSATSADLKRLTILKHNHEEIQIVDPFKKSSNNNNKGFEKPSLKRSRYTAVITDFMASKVGKSKISKALRLNFDTLKKKAAANTDFALRMQSVAEEPENWRNQLWVMLELPHSSFLARFVQVSLSIMIVITVFVLYTETMVIFVEYNESCRLCGDLVSLYCANKHDPVLDPGCFVLTSQGPSNEKLQFDCDSMQCFGKGFNFGSELSNYTCSSELFVPFQSKEQLIYNYGAPYLFSSREDMHRINPVCTRLECMNSLPIADGTVFWNSWEILSNTIFSIEALLRILATNSIYGFLMDKMNLFDVLSIFPFYAEISLAYLRGIGYSSIDFSILSSSPDPLFFVMMRSFKIFRLFKLTRHFRATKVLFETASKAWKQLLGIISLLMFLVVVFAILLHEVEAGNACYVGDKGCEVPESLQALVHEGDRIYINKMGNPSQFSNAFYGLWYSVVTLTTTGYGDIVPQTNAGQIMGIFLMLSGAFYMSMPLTAAASTFYQAHLRYTDSTKKIENDEEHKEEDDPNAKKKKESIMKIAELTDEFDQKLKSRILALQGIVMQMEFDLKSFMSSLKQNSIDEDKVNPNISKISKSSSVSKLCQKLTTMVEQFRGNVSVHSETVRRLAIIAAKKQMLLFELAQIYNIKSEDITAGTAAHDHHID